jgi:adenylate kinase family enzyme
MKRVMVLGRGGSGKSALARQLGDVTGLPVIELDTLFWRDGLTAMDAAQWAAVQHKLAQRDTWIIDGDLGPYDEALDIRLRAADTIIVLDLSLPRAAWRTLRRGRERADYWRWVWAYRRHYLPRVMKMIAENAPDAEVQLLRSPGMIRCFVCELAAAQDSRKENSQRQDPGSRPQK